LSYPCEGVEFYQAPVPKPKRTSKPDARQPERTASDTNDAGTPGANSVGVQEDAQSPKKEKAAKAQGVQNDFIVPKVMLKHYVVLEAN
jgi:hypothetical protein